MLIVVEIGASFTKLGYFSSKEKHFEIERFKTFKDFKKQLSALKEKIDIKKLKLEGMVLGIAGTLDPSRTKLIQSANLQDYKNKPILKLFEDNFKCPIFIFNDTELGGLGEIYFGSQLAQQRQLILYLTIGTGVGGCFLVNGWLDKAYYNFEPGHQIIVPNGRKCSCGRRGCWEAYVSGSAFKKYHKVLFRNCQDAKILKEYAKNVALGLSNLVSIHSPELIILGGGLLTEPNFPLKEIRQFLKKISFLPPPQIIKAKLKELSALFGGLVVAQVFGIVDNFT